MTATERTVEPLRIALVIPRYGDTITGGAELHARWLAERLAGAGHSVEVLTTRAVDHHSWRNELPAGATRVGPITVRRFDVDERDPGIHGELERAITLGMRLTPDEERLWMRHGVHSQQLNDHVASIEADVVLAMPYLFGTTYGALTAAGDRGVLIPCLHDEPYARLGLVAQMLEGARGVMFNTPAERRLAGRFATVDRAAIVGVGFEAPERLPRKPRRLRLPERFLLYVGRREGGKNTPLLIDLFQRYRRRRGGDVRLVFMGSGDPVPRAEGFHEVRPDWELAPHVYAACSVVCQPSVNESLSIVLMQGWLAERPALVHGECAVTRDLCERSNGGLWFSSYAGFEAAVDELMRSDDLRRALGAQGGAFVRSEYSWRSVLDRFQSAVGEWF